MIQICLEGAVVVKCTKSQIISFIFWEEKRQKEAILAFLFLHPFATINWYGHVKGEERQTEHFGQISHLPITLTK